MIIKPIETLYKGYRFRSRLEARWAIFFDVANIKWEYETEGFNVNNTRYLPDFYLPELKIYVEVKPNGLDIESRVIKDVKKGQRIHYVGQSNKSYSFSVQHSVWMRGWRALALPMLILLSYRKRGCLGLVVFL